MYKTSQKIDGCEPDVKIHKKYYIYIRPDIQHILPHLLQNSDVKVCIYSTMMSQNIEPMINAVLENIGFSKYIGSILIFDQSFCVPDPSSDKHYEKLKDLALIWNQEKYKEYHLNPKNTILIENDVQKCYKCAANLIRMIPYEEKDVISCSKEEGNIIEMYLKYLDNLINSEPTDVVEYLEKNPLPIEITRLFEKQTEDLIKSKMLNENENKEVTKIHEEEWKKVKDCENKEEKIVEMMKILNEITLHYDEQD